MFRCVLLKGLGAGRHSRVGLVRGLSTDTCSGPGCIADRRRYRTGSRGPGGHVCGSVQFRSIGDTTVKYEQTPTSTDSAEDVGHTEDGDNLQYGQQTKTFVSRTTFRKMSPELQDLKYRDTSEDDSVVERFKSKTGRRNTPYWYFLQCKKLIKNDKLAEAIQLFEGDMLRGERLQPEEFNYTVIIGGCGRAGYVKKAFQLYNNMKKRGLEPSDATYTALFNACSQSPWKQTGLEQALKLRQELRRKNVPLAAITQHALLKTLAMAGDMKACFQVLREMLQNRQPITQETFQYLLMCCVEDKQQGFRLALQVWHQMLNAGLKPDTQNYNLLLRVARDCGIGDLALASVLLLKGQEEPALKDSPRMRGQRSKVNKEKPPSKLLDMDTFESRLFAAVMPSDGHALESDGQWQPSNSASDELGAESGAESSGSGTDALAERCLSVHASHPTQQTQLMPMSPSNDQSSSPSVSPSNRLPNLLDPSNRHSGVVALGTVNSAFDRLALMGDLEGFLNKMASDGLSPTIKTLTLLADVMEPTSQSVQSLISVAKQNGVKLDVAFFNTLIRKSAKAGDLEGAKAVKALMVERKQAVNAQTFCAIALACWTKKDGLWLLSDMEACGVAANAHIFSALIGRATQRLDYAYLHELLRQMHRLQVPPNEVIIRQLEFAAQYPPSFDRFKSRNTYLEKIDGFRGFYREWLKFMPGQETPHPWEKYRLPQPENHQHGPDSQSHETTQSSQ
ncbi:pentatricopeptide repeat-containing protein 1, mitochondrial [Brachyhypopomus gauderio]|uniref:pentatricopeptide repeat-containing protein 1, mitochondrial n=1 Tax=Brachyhypopomus gauderio TaxID=698409 RepID=UPI0040431D83